MAQRDGGEGMKGFYENVVNSYDPSEWPKEATSHMVEALVNDYGFEIFFGIRFYW